MNKKELLEHYEKKLSDCLEIINSKPKSKGGKRKRREAMEDIFYIRDMIASLKVPEKVDPVQYKVDVALRSRQKDIETRRPTLGQTWAIKKTGD